MVPERALRAVGVALAADYVLVAVVKFCQGAAVELLWISHVALLVACLGLILRIALLPAMAFVMILVPHTFWLADLGLRRAGLASFGLTDYLESASIGTWLGTLHHFFLLPILIFVLRRWIACNSVRRAEALLGAIAAYAFLMVICRAVTPSFLNINFSYGVLPGVDWSFLSWLNGLPGRHYVPLLILGTAAVTCLPGLVALRLLAGSRGGGFCTRFRFA